MNKLLLKIRNKLMFLFRNYVFQYPRVIKYKILSDCKSVLGKPVLYQPLLLTGKGKIIFGENVKIGVAQYNGRRNLNRKNGVDKWTQGVLSEPRKGVHDDAEETQDL